MDIAGQVVSGTPRRSLRLIDLIYAQDGGRHPEVLVTDTGSYSGLVFGLVTLLGFDYRPQLADLAGAKLWRLNPASDYGPLDPAARGRIDLDRVQAHWPSASVGLHRGVEQDRPRRVTVPRSEGWLHAHRRIGGGPAIA